jgi:chemotaxis protein CheD
VTGPRLQVGIAELEVGRSPVRLQAVALGSCIAVILHDPVAHAGGLAHVLLPSQHIGRPRPDQPARAVPTAISALLEGMLALGADPARLTARLVGGASMFAALQPSGALQMGERNIAAARAALRQHGLRLIGEAVGGDFGRTVELDVASGKVLVTSYQRGTVEL